MRVALVHHWFVTRGGGERVAEAIASLFPSAEVFTLVASPAGLPESLRNRRLHTSLLARLPLARTHHRHFLPLYPAATESLDLRGFDLVLSSDSGPVKGVRIDPSATHICYCHSPMRYLWDGFAAYRDAMRGVARLLFTAVAPRVRRWDLAAAQRVTHFLANSRYVADRIERAYGRPATVLHPPIDLHLAPAAGSVTPGEHYLCAGRLVPYKRTELLLEAAHSAGRALRIAGTGPELGRLRTLAASLGARVEFLGELSTAALWAEYAGCRALLFAADEDFGMVPLEAQACGRPVIAYGVGGSLETVRAANAPGFENAPGAPTEADKDRPTGLFFFEQTPAAAADAILAWEREYEAAFAPEHARAWAAEFGTAHFLEQYRAFVVEHVPAAAALACTPEQALRTLQAGL